MRLYDATAFASSASVRGSLEEPDLRDDVRRRKHTTGLSNAADLSQRAIITAPIKNPFLNDDSLDVMHLTTCRMTRFPSSPSRACPAPSPAKPAAARHFAQRLLGLVVCAVFGLAPAAFADSTWINTGTGAWQDPANWTAGGVPGDSDRAVVNNGGTIRFAPGESGTALQLFLGTVAGGNGFLEIAGGSVSTNQTGLGYGPGGTGSAVVTDGGWLSTSTTLYVGSSGTGSLVINGGVVNSGFAYVGNSDPSAGSVTITSGTWNSGPLTVGRAGKGTLQLNSGLVTSSQGAIADGYGGSGKVTITSSGSWINSGTLFVGNSGTGTLLIEGGLVQNSYARLGAGTAGNASVTVNTGTWKSTDSLSVGYAASGSLTINGGYVENGGGYIGHQTGSRGTVLMTSGTWINDSLRVGASGTGSLTVTGGRVESNFAWVGEGSRGTVTITDAAWVNRSTLWVGYGTFGNGTLTVNSGGYVRSNFAYIGATSSGTGTVTVSSGTWENAGDFMVGDSGRNNTFTIQAGGIATTGGNVVIGDGTSGSSVSGSGNKALVTGEGSSWKIANGLVVGVYGSNNTLTVQDGGLVQVGNSADDTIRFSTAGSSVNNFLRVDDGYVALFGDRVDTFEDLIAGGVIQVWNGSAWVVSTNPEVFTITYYATNEEGLAETGYNGLGGFTVLTAVPEPTVIALVGIGVAGVLLARRRRAGSNAGLQTLNI